MEGHKSQSPRGRDLAMLVLRFSASLSYVCFYCKKMVPWLRPRLLDIHSRSLSDVIGQLLSWFRVIEVSTTLTSYFSLVDIVYTGSRLNSALGSILGSGESVSFLQPSPWGHPKAIAIYGLAGFWIVWQNYFQFDFRLSAAHISNSMSSTLNKKRQQTIRLFIAFDLLGNSSQLPGSRQVTGARAMIPHAIKMERISSQSEHVILCGTLSWADDISLMSTGPDVVSSQGILRPKRALRKRYFTVRRDGKRAGIAASVF
ncbi:hypothetical protein FPOA_12385 [Fusarium poae]|uniref:Uncharacterized protein n=1 Tax=Fusarium poae TaxID=36050 RepID=A0A1B8A9F8_FUSPO|nr:hypothetical protein FPOA_12385 [Fusarium poae]